MPQEVPREEQSMPPVQVAPPEQVLMQIPPIQQVEPPPLADIEIHKIHSDFEEESGPSTFHVNILASMTSSIPSTQLSKNIFYSSFSQFSFSELNLSPIIEATTSTPTILIDVPSSTSPVT